MSTSTQFQLSGEVPGTYGGNTSPPNLGNNVSHQRVYQACIPCRQRKVKCDLGSVDNPHDPPCSRCRREAKQCYFASERRKKRKTGDARVSEEREDSGSVFEITNGVRKRVKSTGESEPRSDDGHGDRPRTPGGRLANPRPLSRPMTARKVQYTQEDEKAAEQTAALLQRGEVHSGHDALNMLHAAATSIQNNSAESEVHHKLPPIVGLARLPSDYHNDSPIIGDSGNTTRNRLFMPRYNLDSNSHSFNTALDSQLAAMKSTPQYNVAVEAWRRMKFVRTGWFTPAEGIEFVVYFYTNLAPLTPVALPDFRRPETHKEMLEEEPMLALTMLVTASRHMKLHGAGSDSRPHAIHDKLWKYLCGMITRVTWGQEQFGGGFCGAGAQPASDVNPLSRKGMRTLGSVESLVLLTEWHPRAMHFPPDEDDSDLMMPEQLEPTTDIGDAFAQGGIGGQRLDAWLEPCWRSDRVCWMLLGFAVTLALEIGIFDETDWKRHATTADGQPLSAAELGQYDKRRGHVKDLLLVYVTQTSGRLGLTSMLPDSYCSPEDGKLINKPIDSSDDIQDATLHFWLRMARMIKEGNVKLFQTRDITRQYIRNGRYKNILVELQGPLDEWRKDFEMCQQIPRVMRSILLIEYHYARAYINSLALQAVAERCARDDVQAIDPPLEMARSLSKPNNVPMTPAALSKHFSGERQIVSRAAESCRSLLHIVADELAPKDYLRYAPVRTYFRIISVAIIMTKTFSLGAFESDVREGLMLLDRTIEALRTSVVDDVHVASRFADLLERLTTNLKPRLVRMAPDGRQGRSHRTTPGYQGSPRPFQPELGMHTLNDQHSQGPQSDAGRTVVPNQQRWQPNASSLASSTGQAFLGLPDETYDLTANDNSLSLMPPPGWTNTSPPGAGFDALSSDTLAMSDGQEYYFGLPLNPLLDVGNDPDIIHNQWGPEIAGTDMLDLLLSDRNRSQSTTGINSHDDFQQGIPQNYTISSNYRQ